MWVDSGRPRFGYDFDVMKRTRALFKLAWRHCKNNIENLKLMPVLKAYLTKVVVNFGIKFIESVMMKLLVM